MSSDLPAGGLLVAQDGYAFELEDRLADAGRFDFTITGPDGRPVNSYELLHDRELHLIVASTDRRHYAHLSQERDARGEWSVDMPALPAGARPEERRVGPECASTCRSQGSTGN